MVEIKKTEILKGGRLMILEFGEHGRGVFTENYF